MSIKGEYIFKKSVWSLKRALLTQKKKKRERERALLSNEKDKLQLHGTIRKPDKKPPYSGVIKTRGN